MSIFLQTAPPHPFWVLGYGFKVAEELVVGDWVENADGEILPVKSVKIEYPDKPVTVYNFEVEEWHTYYVSDEEILVHNMCAMTSKNVFPENPNDLLPEIPRNSVVKSNGTVSQTIYPSDYIRIRAEQHPLLQGEIYNPRHHGVHYHVEYRIDSSISWNNRSNVNKYYPNGYVPGSGTGFIAGEAFPR